MTSATDELLVTGYPNSLRPELHKALKARGIDYWLAQGITFWNRDDGCECLAYGYKVNGVPKLAIKVVGFTDPEQAIAATLGSCNCSNNCTNSERTETCHIDLVGYNQHEDRFQCRSCDWSMRFKRGTWPQFNYCPNCGRRCVG